MRTRPHRDDRHVIVHSGAVASLVTHRILTAILPIPTVFGHLTRHATLVTGSSGRKPGHGSVDARCQRAAQPPLKTTKAFAGRKVMLTSRMVALAAVLLAGLAAPASAQDK